VHSCWEIEKAASLLNVHNMTAWGEVLLADVTHHPGTQWGWDQE